MIEISIFGWLVGTLASAVSLVFLVTGLLSLAFVSLTGAAAIEQRLADMWTLRVRRASLVAGGVFALLSLVVASLAVRVGGAFTTAVALAAGGAAAFGVGSLGALVAVRGGFALVKARQRRRLALDAAGKERARLIDEGRRRYSEGADLREEVAEAQAALERLRSALRSLEDVHLALSRKVAESSSAEAPGGAGGAGSSAEYARLREDVETKLDLGRRVLAAAEVAAFRLACFEPLRRLLRRRPHEATAGLSKARTAAELEACIGRCFEDIQAFLGELSGAQAVLDALAPVRPSGFTEETGGDPLVRARAEIEAVGAAYRAVLERAGVARMRLTARAGMEQVVSAAGAVSESARTMGLEEGELKLLLDEVARADIAMAVTSPGGVEVRALTDALARSVAALDRNDATSLDELVRAMREIG